MLPHGIEGKTMKLRCVADDGTVTEFDILAEDLTQEYGITFAVVRESCTKAADTRQPARLAPVGLGFERVSGRYPSLPRCSIQRFEGSRGPSQVSDWARGYRQATDNSSVQ
jgi:hypothetical protein